MNNFNPLVSIVIPVYNGANYMAEAIDSALAQTYSNIEVLVINDGSKDNGVTRNIALSYGTRIRYFEKENGGVATALNLGIAEMKGEYFSWLSHDDKYFPYKIEKQVDFLSTLSHKEVILYSDMELIDKDSKFIFQERLPHYSPEEFRPAFILRSIVNGCTLIVPKICFENCGIFDVTLRTTQDYDLWFRISEKFDFIHFPEVLISSRQHENQDTLKLQRIVVNEKDNLHLHFLKNISEKEIIRFSKGNPTAYYIEFVRNMESAGCIKSRNLALMRAFKQLFKTKILTLIQNFYKLISLMLFIGIRRFIVNHLNDNMIRRTKSIYKALNLKHTTTQRNN